MKTTASVNILLIWNADYFTHEIRFAILLLLLLYNIYLIFNQLFSCRINLIGFFSVSLIFSCLCSLSWLNRSIGIFYFICYYPMKKKFLIFSIIIIMKRFINFLQSFYLFFFAFISIPFHLNSYNFVYCN